MKKIIILTAAVLMALMGCVQPMDNFGPIEEIEQDSMFIDGMGTPEQWDIITDDYEPIFIDGMAAPKQLSELSDEELLNVSKIIIKDDKILICERYAYAPSDQIRYDVLKRDHIWHLTRYERTSELSFSFYGMSDYKELKKVYLRSIDGPIEYIIDEFNNRENFEYEIIDQGDNYLEVIEKYFPVEELKGTVEYEFPLYNSDRGYYYFRSCSFVRNNQQLFYVKAEDIKEFSYLGLPINIIIKMGWEIK